MAAIDRRCMAWRGSPVRKGEGAGVARRCDGVFPYPFVAPLRGFGKSWGMRSVIQIHHEVFYLAGRGVDPRPDYSRSASVLRSRTYVPFPSWEISGRDLRKRGDGRISHRKVPCLSAPIPTQLKLALWRERQNTLRPCASLDPALTRPKYRVLRARKKVCLAS